MVRTHTVCLDTHAVVWLYAGHLEKMGPEARALIDSAALQLSLAVLLELQFLFELGRITAPATEVLRGLQQALDVHVATEPFKRFVSAALAESWTRDPFDRLIVAHARLLGATLLTKDRRIASAYGDTRW